MSPPDAGRAAPPPPGRLVVHVLGPPESGKAQACAALVERFGGELFHLPTAAARRAAADPAFAARLRTGTDRLGWVPPPLVDELLGGAGGASGLFAPSHPGPLSVQGFPVLAGQVRPWLRLAARYPGIRLAAVEIRVAARVLDTRRAVSQMACSSCAPDVSARVVPPTDAGEQVRARLRLLGEPRPGRSAPDRPTSKPVSKPRVGDGMHPAWKPSCAARDRLGGLPASRGTRRAGGLG